MHQGMNQLCTVLSQVIDKLEQIRLELVKLNTPGSVNTPKPTH